MIGGNLFIKIISFFSAPIIARLYTPSDFGYFAVIVSISTFLSVIPHIGLTPAIVTVSDQAAANKLFSYTNLLTVIFSIGGGLIIIFLSLIIGLDYFYIIIPVIILLQMIQFSLKHYFIRINEFSVISKTIMSQSVVTIFLNVAFGILGIGGKGLIFSLICGYSVGLLFSYYEYSRNTSFQKTNFEKMDISGFLLTLRDNINYVRYNFINTLLFVFIKESPVVYLNHFFSKVDAGYFSFLLKIFNPLINIIEESVSPTLLNELNKQRINQLKLHKTLIYTILFSTGFIISALTILIIFGDYLFLLFLGDNWTGISKISIYLLPIIFFNAMNKIWNQYFITFNTMNIKTLLTLVSFISYLGAGVIGIQTNSIEKFYIVIVTVEIMISASTIFLLINKINGFKR